MFAAPDESVDPIRQDRGCHGADKPLAVQSALTDAGGAATPLNLALTTPDYCSPTSTHAKAVALFGSSFPQQATRNENSCAEVG